MASRVLSPLYLITDRHHTRHRPLLLILKEALQAGVRLIQLREKDLSTRHLIALGNDVLALAREYGATLMINDRLDIVQAIGADGVHLRSDSLPVRAARRLLGPQDLLGVSCHSVQAILQAETEGAHFAVLGPIYPTPSKQKYGPPLGLGVLQKARGVCHIPIYAIGGITAQRVSEVKEAGAYGVAMISFLLEAESVFSATKLMLDALQES